MKDFGVLSVEVELEDVSVTVRKVWFPAEDGSRLCGYFTGPLCPSVGEKYPAVLMLSGWRGDKHGARSVRLAEKLALAGIASLRFDFRGHGESEGDIRRASVKTELEDVQAARWFLARRRKIDDRRVGIIGASIGGSVALLAMSRLPVFYRCAVLVSARSDFHSDLKPGTYSFSNERGRRVVNRVMMKSGRAVDFYAESDMVDAAKIPVLVLHGTLDTTVPFRQSQLLAMNQNHFTLVPVEGAGHLMRGEHLDFVIDRAAEFFKSHLKGQ